MSNKAVEPTITTKVKARIPLPDGTMKEQVVEVPSKLLQADIAFSARAIHDSKQVISWDYFPNKTK